MTEAYLSHILRQCVCHVDSYRRCSMMYVQVYVTTVKCSMLCGIQNANGMLPAVTNKQKGQINHVSSTLIWVGISEVAMNSREY